MIYSKGLPYAGMGEQATDYDNFLARQPTAVITSSFEELTKTLELVSDPIARLILSKRIAADLAGRGIEVNFGESHG